MEKNQDEETEEVHIDGIRKAAGVASQDETPDSCDKKLSSRFQTPQKIPPLLSTNSASPHKAAISTSVPKEKKCNKEYLFSSS